MYNVSRWSLSCKELATLLQDDRVAITANGQGIYFKFNLNLNDYEEYLTYDKFRCES